MGESIDNINNRINEIDNEINQKMKLDLLGKEVEHKKYGKGAVVGQDDIQLEIKFNGDLVKKFSLKVAILKKILKVNDKKISKVFGEINTLDEEKQELEKSQKNLNQKIFIKEKENYFHNEFIKQKTEQLVEKLCVAITSQINKNNFIKFDAVLAKNSNIKLSKSSWKNEYTKGLYYIVSCKNIEDENLYGAKEAKFKISLHLEGKGAKAVLEKLAEYGISKENCTAEENVIVLDFSSEEKINESLNELIREVKKLDEKYTEKIDKLVDSLKISA